MVHNLFDLTQFLMEMAGRLPLILVLIVGLIVCYQQRHRRPRASWLMGVALVMELTLSTIGWHAYSIAMLALGLNPSFEYSDSHDLSFILRLAVYYLPATTISAAIWSCALWSALMIDDRRATETE